MKKTGQKLIICRSTGVCNESLTILDDGLDDTERLVRRLSIEYPRRSRLGRDCAFAAQWGAATMEERLELEGSGERILSITA